MKKLHPDWLAFLSQHHLLCILPHGKGIRKGGWKGHVFMKLLDYATQIDIAMLETQRVEAITLPRHDTTLTVPAYVVQVASRYAQMDGLSQAAYVSKLILRDQAERLSVAQMD